MRDVIVALLVGLGILLAAIAGSQHAQHDVLEPAIANRWFVVGLVTSWVCVGLVFWATSRARKDGRDDAAS